MHSRGDPTAVTTLRAAGAGPRVSRQDGIAVEVASQGLFPGRSAHLRPQDPADLGRGTGRVLLLDRHRHLQQLTRQRRT